MTPQCDAPGKVPLLLARSEPGVMERSTLTPLPHGRHFRTRRPEAGRYRIFHEAGEGSDYGGE
jgi:hypothetical protein